MITLDTQIVCKQSRHVRDSGHSSSNSLQALKQAETLKQEGNKLYADDDLEPAVVRAGPHVCPCQSAAVPCNDLLDHVSLHTH